MRGARSASVPIELPGAGLPALFPGATSSQIDLKAPVECATGSSFAPERRQRARQFSPDRIVVTVEHQISEVSQSSTITSQCNSEAQQMAFEVGIIALCHASVFRSQKKPATRPACRVGSYIFGVVDRLTSSALPRKSELWVCVWLSIWGVPYGKGAPPYDSHRWPMLLAAAS